MKPAPVVVDTNVPIIANTRSSAATEWTPACILTCTRELQNLEASGHLVIDDRWRLIGEYRRHLRSDGQPGPGDAFLKFVLTNHANPKRCTKVTLTPRGSDPEDFEEFPRDSSLEGFDPADRKFVAVSASHSESTPILQGMDSKWWGFREALERLGVRVRFLCEHDISRKHRRKSGHR